jgi:CheY-like chemotaxis protein
LDRAAPSAKARRERRLHTVRASILLVEDDENDAFFLTRALKRAGTPNAIQRVGDGRSAMEYLQGIGRFEDRSRYPLPGLVLLDLKLPHLMGLDVLKWIRGQEQFTSTPVVVFSASDYPDDIANSQRHGADAYLVKPSNLDQLDVLARTIHDAWLAEPLASLPMPDLAGKRGSRPRLAGGQMPVYSHGWPGAPRASNGNGV